MATDEKGTQENPYSLEEYESLSESGQWQGGYITDETGSVVYALKDAVFYGSNGYSGYGSSGSGSDPWGSHWWGSWWGSSWWGSYPYKPWDDDDDSNGDNTGGGGGGNTGGGNNNTGGGGGGGNSSGGSTPKSRALDIIKRFENRVTSVAYPNISKTKFIQDLREQISTPALVKQGENGTCGIAAICKYLLE